MNTIPYIIMIAIGVVYLDFAAWYSIKMDEIMGLNDPEPKHRPLCLFSWVWDHL